MEGEIDENAVLDYAIFNTSATQNSYEAVACSEGKTETVASGPLDHLALHLSEAKECQGSRSCSSFKLRLVENRKGSLWFTKVTLARFLHIVNMPNALKAASVIEGEMSQLEETKRFHISLYAKDQDRYTGVTADTSCLKEAGRNQKIKAETASSDATKNELLRALDLRLLALEEELATSFNRAAGATCYTQQICDLSTFTQHFGAIDLRNFLLKLLARRAKNEPTDPSVVQPLSSHDRGNIIGNPKRDTFQTARQPVVERVNNAVSQAKIAQAERHSSSESEESDGSSDEDQLCTERSRPLMRSATPRRSASPMRRLQVGRSGSQRSTSIAIKGLNYFPARERATSIRDNNGSDSGDEGLDQPTKKPENPVRRMSVQDAISLFNNKQKDQNLESQKRIASGEVSASIAAKSVLRRWSSGMGDSLALSSHENALDAAAQKSREENNSEVKDESSNTIEGPEAAQSSDVEKTMLPPDEPVMPKGEEVNDQATSSAEWNRQKEAELNEMFMKMMESKPGKYRGTNVGNDVKQDVPSGQKGDFLSKYREKRNEKLQAEQTEKRAGREAHFKGMKQSLSQSKASMVQKSTSATEKRNSPNTYQRPQRNSSPPVLAKKEVTKQGGTREASSKTSSTPATRNSWSGGSLPRTNGTSMPKSLYGMVSTNSKSSRRKSLPTPSPTQPSPRTERLQQTKVQKGTPPDVKPSLKGQEEKKQKSVTKSSKSVKTKSPAIPGEYSGVLSAKPSFHNKVTKKSSVVPLESKDSKPFLKKGTGTGPRCSPMAARPKTSQPDTDSSKKSGNLIQAGGKESSDVTAEPTPDVLELNGIQPEDRDTNLEVPVYDDATHNTKDWDQGICELDSDFKNAVELPIPEIQADEDIEIQSAAWVETEHKVGSASHDSSLPDLTVSPELASAAALPNRRVYHSLSQILQADNNEPEIIEWGKAENPPALIYQKGAPKGLKRLLKFPRKSKGGAHVTGLANPSVFSVGEDDTEESKAASKRNSDSLFRKAALQAKGYDLPKSMFAQILDGGNSSNRSMEFQGMNEYVSAQSTARPSTILDRLREGQNSASTTSTKGAANQVRQSFDNAQLSFKSLWK